MMIREASVDSAGLVTRLIEPPHTVCPDVTIHLPHTPSALRSFSRPVESRHRNDSEKDFT